MQLSFNWCHFCFIFFDHAANSADCSGSITITKQNTTQQNAAYVNAAQQQQQQQRAQQQISANKRGECQQRFKITRFMTNWHWQTEPNRTEEAEKRRGREGEREKGERGAKYLVCCQLPWRGGETLKICNHTHSKKSEQGHSTEGTTKGGRGGVAACNDVCHSSVNCRRWPSMQRTARIKPQSLLLSLSLSM